MAEITVLGICLHINDVCFPELSSMYRSVIWYMETTRMLTNERHLLQLHALTVVERLIWASHFYRIKRQHLTSRGGIIKDDDEDQVIP